MKDFIVEFVVVGFLVILFWVLIFIRPTSFGELYLSIKMAGVIIGFSVFILLIMLIPGISCYGIPPGFW